MNDIHIIADFHASDTSDMESQLNHAVTVAREKQSRTAPAAYS